MHPKIEEHSCVSCGKNCASHVKQKMCFSKNEKAQLFHVKHKLCFSGNEKHSYASVGVYIFANGRTPVRKLGVVACGVGNQYET